MNMKNKKWILIMIFIIGSKTFAQISSITIGKQEEVITPYDGKESINKTNFLSHIGQTLYLMESKFAKESGGYSNFFTKPSFDMTKRVTYKSVRNKRYTSLTCSDYQYMQGRYFYVDDIIMHPNQSDNRLKTRGYLQLKDKESGDLLYFWFDSNRNDLPLNCFSDFLTVEYFEKLKEMYLEKEFVYIYKGSGIYPERAGIRNIIDGSERGDIRLGTILRCVDVSLNESMDKPSILAIMENSEYGKSFVWIDDIVITDVSYRKFQPFEEYQKELEDSKRLEEALINVHGKEIADLILRKNVKLGFTTEMCILSWGYPDKINKTTGSYGVHEQWVYGNGRYLYFENGILTTIQN